MIESPAENEKRATEASRHALLNCEFKSSL